MICRRASASATSAMQPGVSSLWMMRVLASPPKSAATPSMEVTRMRPPPTEAADRFNRRVGPSSARTAVLGWAARSSTGWMLNASPACSARAKLSGRRGSSGFMPSSPATMARSVPWPRPVVAKLPYSPMSARTGASPKSWRAVRPMRAAPAVWLEEGPIMTGPRTSNRRIVCQT